MFFFFHDHVVFLWRQVLLSLLSCILFFYSLHFTLFYILIQVSYGLYWLSCTWHLHFQFKIGLSWSVYDLVLIIDFSRCLHTSSQQYIITSCEPGWRNYLMWGHFSNWRVYPPILCSNLRLTTERKAQFKLLYWIGRRHRVSLAGVPL